MSYRLYGFGSNGNGQLGIGDNVDYHSPALCVFEDELVVDNHCLIAAGGNHTLLKTSDGRLWATGDIKHHHRAYGSDMRARHHFTDITFRDNAYDFEGKFDFISATWEASILVSSEGTSVYTSGIGSKGELGQGLGITESVRPTKLQGFPPPDTSIVDIASCVSHTISVLSNGDVYGWGNGRRGQLGTANDMIWSPVKVDCIPFKAVRAVCGREFSFIVGGDNSNEYVILGSDKWNVKLSAPNSISGWTSIAASWGSVFVLLSDGRLLSWGRNDHGQLAPRGLPSLVKIAIGSEHALANTADGKILAWGWAEHGNCGLPGYELCDVKDGWNEFCTVEKSSSVVLGAGCATSFLVVKTSPTNSHAVYWMDSFQPAT